MAESDRAVLLWTMEPVLHPEPYDSAISAACARLIEPFATIAEAEGLTIVAPLAELRVAGMRSEPWARIRLTVHSDLAAVGLKAAFATALGADGMSCNVIAGSHHDHLFVQWNQRGDALAALRRLSIA